MKHEIMNDELVTIQDRVTGEILEVTEEQARELGFVICDDCGYWYHESDTHIAHRGNEELRICNDCLLSGDWFTCRDCGRIFDYEDGVEVNSPSYSSFLVCESCSDDYYVCEDCGGLFSSGYMWRMGADNICDYCSDDYCICADCGEILRRDDAYWDDEDEEWYCNTCYREGNRNLRHGYNYKPAPVFHEHYDDDSEAFYLGVELEVDKGDCWRDLCGDVHNHFDDEERKLYMKYDGSLDEEGVELVSHPCTLLYHMEKFKWANLFEICRRHNYRSHNTYTCGLHVHVGNNEIGENTNLKLAILVDRLWDKLFTFSRRRDAEWCHRLCLQERIDREKMFNENCGKKFDLDDAKLLELTRNASGTHYSAVNTYGDATVEIRIFRGTLNLNTFFASLQLTSNLVKYAMSHTATECWGAMWKDVIDIQHYPELDSYLEQKGL